ncbi:hypothetical protein BDF20DRAFT_389754 [Mycotypha africana]|uniref:uncharacterized protein n=1 Tax=Mycotypha africana TaxID=64632 RepID=UPI002300F067|nr:uncharacterized protein BDF20DRAFT_389754 [Mycotypha africana]KAI8984445.1 hypothetical protein BDF20DRAFT_389754 [Mycotypha africana]
MDLFHQICLPKRLAGTRRPKSKVYRYQSFRGPTSVVQHACPCCWEHFPQGDVDRLRQHIIKIHLDAKYIKDFEYQIQTEDREQQQQQLQEEEKEKRHPQLSVNKESHSSTSISTTTEDKANEFYKSFTDLMTMFKDLFMNEQSQEKAMTDSDSELAFQATRRSNSTKRVSFQLGHDEEEEAFIYR